MREDIFEVTHRRRDLPSVVGARTAVAIGYPAHGWGIARIVKQKGELDDNGRDGCDAMVIRGDKAIRKIPPQVTKSRVLQSL